MERFTNINLYWTYKQQKRYVITFFKRGYTTESCTTVSEWVILNIIFRETLLCMCGISSWFRSAIDNVNIVVYFLLLFIFSFSFSTWRIFSNIKLGHRSRDVSGQFETAADKRLMILSVIRIICNTRTKKSQNITCNW